MAKGAKKGVGQSAVKVNTGGVIRLYVVTAYTPRYMVTYVYAHWPCTGSGSTPIER